MKLFLLLGNQLFAPKYLNDFKDHIFYMAEDYDLCTFEKHHKQKILLFLSSMRSFGEELKSKNFNLIYKDLNKDFKISYEKKLEKIIKDRKIKETKNTLILKRFIDSNFKNHPGDTKKFWFPTTRKDANKWLDEFLKERIKLFGDYEDAVTDKSNTVFHSALSPLINLGLLTPGEIIEKLRKFENKISMNSLEGYKRQMIGWRELIRGIYQNFDERLEKTNFLTIKEK